MTTHMNTHMTTLSAAALPAVSPRARRSVLELFLDVLDGLFAPESLEGSVDGRAQLAAYGPFHSLDTPAYLRRGLRIPELD